MLHTVYDASYTFHKSLKVSENDSNFILYSSLANVLRSIMKSVRRLFGLISRIPGLLYGVFSVSVVSRFQLSLFPSV